jgi:[acyl-carrier-protein] S-malonyltransferase
VRLSVSLPAHSTLMGPAAQQLSLRLGQLEIRPPRYRYVSSVDAAEHTDAEDIRATLVRQLSSPVRWSQTVRALLRLAPTLIECGPGRVLTGLNRRIERSASFYALEDPESLAAAVAATSSAARSGTAHA